MIDTIGQMPVKKPTSTSASAAITMVITTDISALLLATAASLMVVTVSIITLTVFTSEIMIGIIGITCNITVMAQPIGTTMMTTITWNGWHLYY
tara:strand:- start:1726 stop:2007 length:282 start_codon:yes stop_codon:yes gene_type:complete